eukprot:gene4578-6257_t
MAGFDWAINKTNPVAADSHMGIPIFANQPAFTLRDRFDLVEGFWLVLAPVIRNAKGKTRDAVLYYGSTAAAMDEALEMLEAQGRRLDALRVRGFPFADEVFDFIAAHDRIYLVEQNRDAQLKTLITTEGGVDPGRPCAVADRRCHSRSTKASSGTASSTSKVSC